ncbi:MAG: ComF family protein [Thermoclostridium sp.]|nr:ComF family protein [Thermoclostridium sp.]
MKNKKLPSFEYILRLFFPPRCISCDCLLPIDMEGVLCRDCEEDIPVLKNREFINPAGNSIGRIFSAFDYEKGIRKAIHNLKFNDRPENAAALVKLALPRISQFLFEAQPHCAKSSRYDIIIPVPIHFRRKQQRGYNQSELLAKNLAKQTKVAFYPRALTKSIHTPPQSSLGRGERLRNLTKAFRLKNPETVRGKRVLLVDDVMTTGSTLEHCARVLTEAGATQVDAFVIAVRRKAHYS